MAGTTEKFYEERDVDHFVSMALEAYNRKDSAEMSNRIAAIEKDHTTLAATLKSHMEWEERNGEELKKTLEKQQELITKLFGKLDNSTNQLNTCKTGVTDWVTSNFISNKDFELYKVRAENNLMTTSQACNSVASKIEVNLKEKIQKKEDLILEKVEANTLAITKYRTILITLGSVFAALQAVIGILGKMGVF